jgi:hypothetical protein
MLMNSPLRSSSRRLWLACGMSLFLPAVLGAQSSGSARTVATSSTVRANRTPAVTSEPAERFAAARAALAQHRSARAASEIHEAAVFVRAQSALAERGLDADLNGSARDLEAVASRVRNGTLTTVRDFDAAVHRSDRNLARHHLARATRAWERRESAAAGRELSLAAQHTERLAQNAGTDADRAAARVVRSTRALSEKLIRGAGYTSDEVGKGFERLGREIDRHG